MASKRLRFLFTSNSLSKGGLLGGLFKILFFQSKKSYNRTVALVSQIFNVSKDRVYLFGAGRMSVYSLLKVLNLSEEDEVIVGGYTCVALTNSVKFADCKMKYVDIDKSTLNIDTKLLREAINDKTKVLIVPHNFGLPYEDLKKIKKDYPQLFIIEDVAHSFGSKLDGEFCGLIGDAGFFSLEFSKPLTCGLGGIMILNNESLQDSFSNFYEKLPLMSRKMTRKILATLKVYNLSYFKGTRFFHTNGLRFLKLFNLQYATSEKEIQGEIPEDYPVKMNPTLSNFLPVQLNNIEQINARKVILAQKYELHFRSFNDVMTVDVSDHILVRYPIVFKDSVSIETVEKIKSDAMEMGINLGVWFNHVIHPIGSLQYCYSEGDCPVGEEVAKRIINLPLNANYLNVDSEIEDLKSIFKKHNIN